MTQLRNTTASTCAAQWKMWLFKVFSVIYLTAVCAAEDPTAVLEQKSARLDVFPSETAEFSCSISGSSSWTFTWYRNEEQLNPASDPQLSSTEDGSLLTITAVTAAQSGRYSCKGVHKTANVSDSQSSNSLELTVYANKPKPKLTRSSSFNPMFPGEAVNFTCTVDVSTGWEYLWFHNSQLIPGSNSKTHSISPVALSNSGSYHCQAKRGAGPFYTEDSEASPLQVSDPPTPTLTLLTPRLDVFENEAVGLSCEVPSSDWGYTWYRNQQKLAEDGDLIMEEDGLLLNITVVSKTHQGLYACKAYLESRKVSSGFSNNVNVIVYDNLPKPTLSKNPAFNPMYAGETVNFTCKVDVSSGWTYQFYRDEEMLSDGGKTISIPLSQADAGEYSCTASRGEVTETGHSEKIRQDVPELPVPSLELKTQWLDVFPTESVKMSCGMQSGSGWTYTWYRDTQEVQADPTVSVDSGGATLSISSASGQHNGGYECKGHLQDRGVTSNSSSQLTLTVYDKKPTVVLTQDPEYKVMFPGESVAFSCHINVSSGWGYLWYKDGSPLVGSENKHSISLVGGTNTGPYSCKAKRGNDQVFTTDASQDIHLEVKDKKPSVTLVQDPQHNLMHTGDSVSFSCHINVSSGWEYLWTRDGRGLPVSGNNHSISSVVTANTGSYKCQATRRMISGRSAVFRSEESQAVRLDVRERPQAGIILLTGWSEVFSTDSLVLRCEVMGSQDKWNYTWFKEGVQISLLPSEKHIVTPQNDPEQSLYTCLGNRTGRPSYSRNSDSFKTKNLLLKRRVLLSISGCLFFGIIAVFIGCIVLRVIRKPADDDEKPEEDNLFPTMAQLKDYSDAPCPLVEYITDAALNASSKEGDENGTICSETTPLPITSQEDQAATSDSHDTTETNGGLVSFQQ